MAKLDLYVIKGCVPCRYIESIVVKHDLPVNIITDGSHALVWDYPTLIMNNASVIKGVTTIQDFLETHYVPKKVNKC